MAKVSNRVKFPAGVLAAWQTAEELLSKAATLQAESWRAHSFGKMRENAGSGKLPLFAYLGFLCLRCSEMTWRQFSF